MDDARSYDFVSPLRAVSLTDSTTPTTSRFPIEFLGRTATGIINEVCGINRVVCGITSKPRGIDRVGVRGQQRDNTFVG